MSGLVRRTSASSSLDAISDEAPAFGSLRPESDFALGQEVPVGCYAKPKASLSLLLPGIRGG